MQEHNWEFPEEYIKKESKSDLTSSKNELTSKKTETPLEHELNARASINRIKDEPKLDPEKTG